MTKKVMPVLVLTAGMGFFGATAKADNPLTEDQLIKAVQSSLSDYRTIQPDMTKSVSGFRVTTTGNNAKVTINMDADGMHMVANYLCVPDGTDLACHIQD